MNSRNLITNVGALAALGLALTGCPSNETPDTGVLPDAVSGADAFADSDAFVGRDAFIANDAFVGTDAGTDANVDAFVVGDAGPVIPPITTTAPHRVAASAAGHDRYFGVAFDRTSGFYVTGQIQDGTAATDDVRTVVAHFTAAGELDTTFGTAGFYTNNFAVGTNGEVARGIGVQSDGKIVIGLTIEHAGAADTRDRDWAVARLLPNGTLDATFGTAGVAVLDLSPGLIDGTSYRADGAWGLAIDATDRIILSGQQVRTGNLDSDFAIVRLTPNGARDATFATNGVFNLDIGETNASARGVTVAADGSIYGSGYYTPVGSTVVTAVAYKLDTNGALVTAFSGDGVYTEAVLAIQTEIYSIGVQGSNLVTAGYGRATGMTNDFISLRINGTTGVRDATYGGRGYAMLDMGWPLGDNARDVVVLPDNRVMMLGQLRGPITTDAPAGDQDAALVMLTPDGALDTTFDTDGVFTTNFGGITDHFWAGAADPRSGRVVVVGIASALPATNDDGAIYLFPSR